MKNKNQSSKCIGCYEIYPSPNEKSRLEGGLRTFGHQKNSTNDLPLVTIITTVYNRAAVIEKAMCSVFSQTYPNIEYIIIDAKSTDGTMDIVQKYSDKIDYFFSEPDGGMYEGMNKGLQLSQGNFIIILNSDDWYENNAIELLVNEAQHTKSDVVSALAVETDWFGSPIRKIPKYPYGHNVMMRMPLRHETMLISSEFYEKTGLYDTNYNIIGDLKKTQQLFVNDAKLSQLDDYVMSFRNTGVASSITESLIIERKKLLSENFAMLAIEEIELLANDYNGSIGVYRDLVNKYSDIESIRNAVSGFLSLHGIKL